MSTIDLSQFRDDDGFTLILGGPDGFIEAASLAKIIIGLTDTVKAIGAVADPDFEIEVGVPDISLGSIRIRTVLRKHYTGMIAGGAIVAVAQAFVPMPKDIIGNLLASYLWDQYKPSTPCKTTVADGKVRIVGDNCDYSMDLPVYEMTQQLTKDSQVRRAARRLIKAVRSNPGITSVAVVPGTAKTREGPPLLMIAREQFAPDNPLDDVRWTNGQAISLGLYSQVFRETRRADARTRLTAIRRSKKKNHWNFNYNGIRILAAITDDNFHALCTREGLALLPGNEIDAELRITQRFLPGPNVWVNEEYQVVKVHSMRRSPAHGGYHFTEDPTQPPALPPQKSR